jgi:hypothetical protein
MSRNAPEDELQLEETDITTAHPLTIYQRERKGREKPHEPSLCVLLAL